MAKAKKVEVEKKPTEVFLVQWECCSDPLKEFKTLDAAKKFVNDLLTHGDENCCSEGLAPNKIKVYRGVSLGKLKIELSFE